MSKFSRRGILKLFGSAPLFLSLPNFARANVNPSSMDSCNDVDAPFTSEDLRLSNAFTPGYLSIVQGPTSDTETLINVVSPRLKKYVYEVYDSNGSMMSVAPYEIVKGPLFYNVDKLKISGLRINTVYTLKIMDGKTAVDERRFRTLDIKKKNPNFALLSCMADDFRFDQAINPMWNRVKAENLDFVILDGDSVYVDSFEFVERQKATEIDMWQRYTDALKRIPYYHWQDLVPTFSVWDDHDFGTNDGDRNFAARVAADRLFHAIYLGQGLSDVWSPGPKGVSSVLKAFGQKFYFMDDRSFRQPNKNQTSQEEFGHWGKEQHEWLINDLSKDSNPAWIFNGNQFFNGVALEFKEAFEQNHAQEFKNFIDQLSKIKAPVVFGSGDVHLSEIMRIPKERIGYETYEFTSSSMHSYTANGWENPMRIEGAYTKEFNFLTFNAQNVNGALKIDVKSVGVPSTPYFTKSFTVTR